MKSQGGGTIVNIGSFFDTVDQSWLLRFVEHRIGDKRLVQRFRIEDVERGAGGVIGVAQDQVHPGLASGSPSRQNCPCHPT